MNKRQRRTRIRQIREELLQMIHERFPLVEYLDTQEEPTGTVAIALYVPYEDTFSVLEATGTRLVDIAADENLPVILLPLTTKPSPVTKRSRRKAA
jgi:hypothetical protein